jgi:O-antigen/teichoic acid export membrane protein
MLQGLLKGAGLRARLIRSSGWTFIGFGTAQTLRLASNLILTRLLFPEAFGLMALITVFIVGLTMLSDVGIAPSIQQNARGDEPDFLNTAWTLGAIRGLVLWLCCFGLAPLAASFYDEPRLQTMLPVAGLSLLIAGFNPTRMESASRHLMLGRMTVLDIITQFISLIVMVALAFALRSVWALVIGTVIGAAIRLVMMHVFLPGPANRFRWETSAALELIHFGKWIFLSTLCGFLLLQGDKAILGRYLTLEKLGIYNIGFFLAGFPQALATNIMSRTMIPLHRECPPIESRENFNKVRKMRFVMTAAVLSLQFFTAFIGIWLVDFLYDDRFAAAGAVVVAMACMGVPFLIGMTYDFSALGRGDSRGFFWLLLVKAIGQISFFILGMEHFGLPGALIGAWFSQVLTHAMVARLAYKHGAWDPWHDLFYAVVAGVLTAVVLRVHWDGLAVLTTF